MLAFSRPPRTAQGAATEPRTVAAISVSQTRGSGRSRSLPAGRGAAARPNRALRRGLAVTAPTARRRQRAATPAPAARSAPPAGARSAPLTPRRCGAGARVRRRRRREPCSVRAARCLPGWARPAAHCPRAM